MAESIRFDFLSTGAGRLARDFKNTGDTAAAAARGAKVLSEIIGTLGQKEGRTAAESSLLARALRQTGDAEDRAAAKAVTADAAIRRLAEATQKDERAALEAAAANRTLGDSFDKLAAKAGGPSLRGALLALSPTLIPVTAGIAAGVGAMGVSFGAAAIGAGLFGATVKSVFSGVAKDNQKLETAQKQLAAAQIARSQATTKAQRESADKQVKAARDTIASIRSEGAAYNQVLDLSKEIGTRWKVTSAQIASPALVPWLKAVSKGITLIRPAIQPVADQFRSWGEAVDRYFSSARRSAEIRRMAGEFGRFSADQLSAIGVFITDIGKGIGNLGRLLAAHGADFGAFSVHLDQWGGAFLRWSKSDAARRDVSKFLAYVAANGPVLKDLLRNLGGALSAFAPGLSSVGALELRLVSDFLGFLARTPKSIAKPLVDTAGALLLLQKTGVLKVGIKVVGAAVKWLTGGVISIGSGATAAAEMRAAFTSGGAAAAAEIRAALAGGGVTAGAGGIGGGAAAGAAAGKAAGGGFLTALRAALTPAAAGVIAGALIRAAGDTLSPAGTFAGKLNKNFQDDGHLWSSTLLHSFTFGGLEAWLTTKIGIPVGRALNNVGSFIHGSWTKTQHDTRNIWGNIGSFLSGSWHKMLGDSGHATSGVRSNFSGMSSTILGAMRRAGQATDAFRTKNLLPVLGTAGRVSGGIQGLQRSINALHGRTVNVGVHGSGSGGVQVTPSSGVPGAKNYSVFFKPAAEGGMLHGGVPGRDSIPIMAMPDEWVIRAPSARGYGNAAMQAVNEGRAVIRYASGGLISGGSLAGAQSAVAGAAGTDSAAEMRANVSAVLAKIKAGVAASQAAGAGIRSTALGGDQGANRALARSMFPWPASMWPSYVNLEMAEAGFNRFARNPSSGAYGIPQALPPTKMPFAAQAAGGSHAGPQIAWMYNYIAGRYGNPVNAWAHEVASHWYAKGGRVPGYASGGTVASKGRAWLNAWQAKHGGGYGAAWGPVVVNEQIARMSAAISRAKSLSGASGLSAGQHKFWAAAAADETKRLGVLKSELTTERAWRYQLGLGELALDKEIKAAGNLKSLAGPVKGWKAQMGRDKATVSAISKMLGYSDAYIKAHPAATPPPKLPPVQHVYGGDIADTIAPILASALAPVSYDQGGWLRPGLTTVLNGTGRPEAVIPSSRGGGAGGWDGTVRLEITGGDQELVTLLRKIVKVKGGGNVQTALGSRLCRRSSLMSRWA